MTKVGRGYRGTWPENPIEKEDLRIGLLVRYPVRGKIRLGKIEVVASDTVLFEDGHWAYIYELSKDVD